MSEAKNKKGRLLFKEVKGFIYGNVLGLFFSVAIYLLSSAVNSVAPLPVLPSVLAAIMYAASVLCGVAVEYSHWLEEQA
jgi:putative effector of murein hydrolase